jgi:putative PIN family toxin of toxin-antitoxin system
MAGEPDYRIFIDSNVLISGIYSPTGTPAKILYLHMSGRVMVVVSQLILTETVLTLKKKKPDALPVLNALLTSSPPEIVKNPSFDQVTSWTEYLHFEDAAIFAAAISAGPDYFVTGDKHFLTNKELNKSGIRIVTSAQMVRLFRL